MGKKKKKIIMTAGNGFMCARHYKTKDEMRSRLPKIGDVVKEYLAVEGGLDLTPDEVETINNTWDTVAKHLRTGKVVYVNYDHIYYTVEFDLPGGKVKESYKPYAKFKPDRNPRNLHAPL